jgi:ADP-ribose pyrophosphatase YjhB (NUDIX family)
VEFKYCPLCATKLVWRPLFGRNRQQCPACQWIHFKDPKVGTGILAEKDGKVVLVRRGINPGRGLWCFPAGFMDSSETPKEAAIREFKEETGLNVDLIGLIDVFYYDTDFRGPGIMVLYQGEVVGGVPRPMDDAVEIGFFAANELPEEEIAFRSHRIALKRWKQGKIET